MLESTSMKSNSAIHETQQADGSIAVTVNGKPLVCPVCGNGSFSERKSLLNSRSGELFGVAWADKSATNFICTGCGYIYWFMA